jgi:hypothetical protein
MPGLGRQPAALRTTPRGPCQQALAADFWKDNQHDQQYETPPGLRDRRRPSRGSVRHARQQRRASEQRPGTAGGDHRAGRPGRSTCTLVASLEGRNEVTAGAPAGQALELIGIHGNTLSYSLSWR